MGKSLNRLISARTEVANEYAETYKEIATGSDRSCAILAAAEVERYLETFIVLNLANTTGEVFKRLTDQNGPLGSFSSKIILAFAMGIIDKPTYNDLNSIRNIRNVFAHSVLNVSFETPQVTRECENLQSGLGYGDNKISSIGSMIARIDVVGSEARKQYVHAAGRIGLRFIFGALSKAEEKEKKK